MESRVEPVTVRNGPGEPNQWGSCVSCRQEPLGTHPGDPNLNAFLRETFYFWLTLAYRSLHLEFAQVL